MTFGVKMADDEKCECCGNSGFDTSAITGKGYLFCNICLEDMQICDCCGEYRNEEEFSFGQDICDSCCEKKADMLQDD
jgi:hypothetical protein